MSRRLSQGLHPQIDLGGRKNILVTGKLSNKGRNLSNNIYKTIDDDKKDKLISIERKVSVGSLGLKIKSKPHSYVLEDQMDSKGGTVIVQNSDLSATLNSFSAHEIDGSQFPILNTFNDFLGRTKSTFVKTSRLNDNYDQIKNLQEQ